MKVTMTSIFVDDQQKALDFYTQVLGFQLRQDIPMGGPRWLTVASPEQEEGPEIVLEPSTHPAVGPFKAALVADGIPMNSFAVTDIQGEVQRLKNLGVHFVQEPTNYGPVITAVFDDTCGNLIQIAQHQTPTP